MKTKEAKLATTIHEAIKRVSEAINEEAEKVALARREALGFSDMEMPNETRQIERWTLASAVDTYACRLAFPHLKVVTEDQLFGITEEAQELGMQLACARLEAERPKDLEAAAKIVGVIDADLAIPPKPGECDCKACVLKRAVVAALARQPGVVMIPFEHDDDNDDHTTMREPDEHKVC